MTMNSAQSLKDIGLKATLPRRTILELFENSKVRHLSAEDVYRNLISEGIDIGLDRRQRISPRYAAHGCFRYTGSIDRVVVTPGPQAPGSISNRIEAQVHRARD